MELNVDANIAEDGDRGPGNVVRDDKCQLLMASVHRVRAYWFPELVVLVAPC